MFIYEYRCLVECDAVKSALSVLFTESCFSIPRVHDHHRWSQQYALNLRRSATKITSPNAATYTVAIFPNPQISLSGSGVPGGGDSGVQTPPPPPNSEGPPKNRAKLNPIVKTVKNC